jgi:hypothetical protein
MYLRFKVFFPLFLFIQAGCCFGQDAPLLSKKVKKANINIITFDGTQISGRVADITLDYILLDAKRYNSPAALAAYYIRIEGNYYKIEVEYIRVAIVTTRKKVGNSAIAGALSGAAVATAAIPEAGLADFAYATAAGVGIGSIVGAVKGLSRHQKSIPILGSSERLIELLNYYE